MTSLPLLPLLLLPVTLFLVHLFTRYTRLSHIPGPFLPALTDLYYQLHLRRGGSFATDPTELLRRLHAHYGPVVRWGPNRVSFASTSAIPLIYGTKDVFPKSDAYRPMVVFSPIRRGGGAGVGGQRQQEVASLITVRDEARMSQIKSYIAAGFSQATWLKQEGQMNKTLEFLVQQLLREQLRLGQQQDVKSRTAVVIPLDKWLSFWTFDTLSELAFSDSRGFLAHGRDVDGVFAGSLSRFRHWKNWVLTPEFEHLVYKSWLSRTLFPFKKNPASALVQLASARIQERKAELGVVGGGKAVESVRDSSSRDLIGRFLAASEQNPQAIDPERDVLALTISTIHAGADTTSSSSGHALANALSHPEVWGMLEREILGARLTFPPAFKEVASLPVLDAVVRESLRYSFSAGIVSERVTTHDTIMCDVEIPRGTAVSVSPYDASNDTTIFGADAHLFRPQRWLEASEQHWQEMEKASFAFLHGRRICPGRHLAWIEMKKVIVTLILSFKISLAGQPVSSFRGSLVRMVDLKVHLESRTRDVS